MKGGNGASHNLKLDNEEGDSIRQRESYFIIIFSSNSIVLTDFINCAIIFKYTITATTFPFAVTPLQVIMYTFCYFTS